jgi:hypothetical protein
MVAPGVETGVPPSDSGTCIFHAYYVHTLSADEAGAATLYGRVVVEQFG